MKKEFSKPDSGLPHKIRQDDPCAPDALEEMCSEEPPETQRTELERLNETLRRTQAELAVLKERYDRAPSGLLVLNAGGRILEANRAGAELLDSTRRSFKNRSFASLLSADSKKTYRVFMKRLLDTGDRRSCDVSLLRKDGTLRYLRVEAVAAKTMPHTDRQIQMTLREVSETGPAEQELNLRVKMLDYIEDAVIVTKAEPIDPPGPQILYVNPALERMTGYKAEEIIGQTPRIFQGEKTDRNELDRLHAALERREAIRVELINYRKDGTEFEVELDIVPLRDEAGKTVRFISIQRYTTLRRRMEQQRRRELERFEKMAATSPCAACSFRLRPDGTSCFPYASPRFQEIFGLRPEALEEDAALLFQRIHPEDIAGIQAAIAESAQAITSFHIEYRVLIPEKGTRWIEVYSMPVEEADGSILWHGTATDITELKQADLALRESAARYRAIFDQAVVGIANTDLQGRYIQVNDQFCRITGRSREDLLKSRIHDITYAEDVPYNLQLLERAAEQGEAFIIEKRYVRPDGSLAWVQNHISPVRDTAGKILYLTTVSADINERKYTELALQEQAKLLDMAHVMIRDREGRILFWNRGMEQLYGWTREEALGKISHELLQTAFPESLAVMDSAILQKGEWEGELTHTCRDGSRLMVASHQVLYRDARGNPVAVLEVNNDITALKQTETALHESEERMAGIIASAMDAILSIDETQRIVLFNKAAEQMFGCSAAEAIGQPVDRFIPKRFRGKHQQNVTDFGRSGDTNRSLSSLDTLYGLRVGGEEFPLEASISKITTDTGHLYTVILRDITARKQAELAAKQKNDAMVQTLKTLKSLPQLNAFLEQVLITLCRCLNGVSTSLWLYDRGQGLLSVLLSYEGEQFHVGAMKDHPGASQPLPAQLSPYWEEIARTHQPLVVDWVDRIPIPPYRDWAMQRGIKSILFVPLLLGDDILGCLTLRSLAIPNYSAAELDLAQALAQHATLALHMNRLAEQAQQAAILQERNRFAQDIHDTLAQGFTGILIQLEAASYSPDATQRKAHLDQARDLARQSLQEARRSVRALRPLALEGERLAGALTHLVQKCAPLFASPILLDIQGDAYLLSLDVEDNLFRICQEALTNAIKYSKATEIKIELHFEPAQVRLSIQDNGSGFDVQTGVQGNGFGLIGMYERAEQIGGQFSLTTHHGQGTRITVTVPWKPTQNQEQPL